MQMQDNGNYKSQIKWYGLSIETERLMVWPVGVNLKKRTKSYGMVQGQQKVTPRDEGTRCTFVLFVWHLTYIHIEKVVSGHDIESKGIPNYCPYGKV